MASKQRERGNPIGPTAKTVATNIKSARRARGKTLIELEEQLAAAGHSISASALSKIERCARRVEVDDLTAIAVALGVCPQDLLCPWTGGDYLLTGMPDGFNRGEVQWWLRGVPLTHKDMAESWLRHADALANLIAGPGNAVIGGDIFRGFDSISPFKIETVEHEKGMNMRIDTYTVRDVKSAIASCRERAREHLVLAGLLGPDEPLSDDEADKLLDKPLTVVTEVVPDA